MIMIKQNNIESYSVDRERERIQRLIIRGGPLCHFTDHMRYRLRDYRSKHPDFDKFLVSIRDYLLEDKKYTFDNIVKFVNDGAEGNWISDSRSIFNMMIKLYNLCLSSKQAANYIKHCYNLYQFMLNTDYKLYNSYQVSIRRDNYDGQARKFISVILEPNKSSQEWGDEYWFDITLSSLHVDASYTSVEIKLRTGAEIFEDALGLFEYSQEQYLKHKLLKSVIKELEDRRIIVLSKETKSDFGVIKRFYDIKDDPGGYYSINKYIKKENH